MVVYNVSQWISACASLADIVNNHLISNLNWPLHSSPENEVKMTSKCCVISLIFVIKCISKRFLLRIKKCQPHSTQCLCLTLESKLIFNCRCRSCIRHTNSNSSSITTSRIQQWGIRTKSHFTFLICWNHQKCFSWTQSQTGYFNDLEQGSKVF